MQLMTLKCPKCSKEVYMDAEDYDDKLEYICPHECFVDDDVMDHVKEHQSLLCMGMVEFADQGTLDGVAVRAIHDKVEELLHEVENLKTASGVEQIQGGEADEPATESE